jgi:hypothetical protein
MYARPWPSSLHRQCSRVRFALWNVGYRTWRKSYSHFDLEIFGFPQPYHWVKRRTNDDRLPLSLWEGWFCSSLGVPIPALIGPPQQCACNVFHYDSYGDHLQTCQTKSAASQVSNMMTGLRISWVPFLVRWVTELRSTKLLRRLVKNGVILR